MRTTRRKETEMAKNTKKSRHDCFCAACFWVLPEYVPEITEFSTSKAGALLLRAALTGRFRRRRGKEGIAPTPKNRRRSEITIQGAPNRHPEKGVSIISTATINKKTQK